MVEAIVVMAAAGALWRRWMGGWGVSAPRWVQMLAGAFLASAADTAGGGELWHRCIAAGLAMVMFLPAHGSYMIMGEPRPDPDNTFLQPFMHWLFGREADGTLLYNVTGLALRYSVFSVPAGAIELLGGDAGGWLYMLAGLLIALAYLLAWQLRARIPATPLNGRGGFTEIGELAAGAIGIGLLAA